jgi:hypothetical protein
MTLALDDIVGAGACNACRGRITQVRKEACLSLLAHI